MSLVFFSVWVGVEWSWGIKQPNDECKSAGLDTRHPLTYNERAHKQNIIYGCATAMIYLSGIVLSTIEELQSLKG